MRVSVTEHRDSPRPDLRPIGELAPSIALPWIAQLRDGMWIGETTLILVAYYLFHVALPLPWIFLPPTLMAASNLVLRRYMQHFSDRSTLGLILALDTVCLTALLALSGGAANPFTLLFLVEITLSAVVLSKSWTWILGVFSILGFASLFWVHVRVPVFESHHEAAGFSVHLVGMWIAFAVGALLITIFIGRVSEALQRQEEETRQLQNRLAQHERLASVATLAAGAAHELGTPLATIAVVARELERNGNDASADGGVGDDARLIRAQVERCSQILRQMGERTEPAGEMPVLISLRELCDQLRNELPVAQQAFVEAEVACDVTALLPPTAFRQALSALVKNALEASPAGRHITLTADGEPGRVRFTIQDAGCGMSPETLNRIAEPFFTTKATGGGLGLGTFLARLFAERMNGSLTFESDLGTGTKAILELPLTQHDGKG